MTHDEYIQYLRNAGDGSVSTAAFDEDWEPIGPLVRADLVREGRCLEADGKIHVKTIPAETSEKP